MGFRKMADFPQYFNNQEYVQRVKDRIAKRLVHPRLADVRGGRHHRSADMSLLIFAIIVILIAILFIWLVDAIPGLPAPFPLVIRILILLVAIIVIANRAGYV